MSSSQHSEHTLRARQLLARFTGAGGLTYETKVELVRKINVELDGLQKQLRAAEERIVELEVTQDYEYILDGVLSVKKAQKKRHARRAADGSVLKEVPR